MKEHLERLTIDDSLLEKHQEAEIFKSIHISSITEFHKRIPRNMFSKKEGASVRVNHKEGNKGVFHCLPDLEVCPQWMQRAIANEVPYYKLPRERIQSSQKIPNIQMESHEAILRLIKECELQLQEKDIYIEKLSVEENLGVYAISNSYGVSGIGYRYIFSVNSMIKNRFGDFFEYSRIFDWTEKNTAISTFFNSLVLPEKKQYNNVSMRIPRIFLSCNAVMELIYLFLFFFNDQAVKQNSPPHITEILNKQKSISPLLNIIENSEQNCIMGGCIDGEGTKRKPTYIFKQGLCENIISKFSTTVNSTCSASAYRLDYSMLPQTKAAKIIIEPGEMSEAEMLSTYDLIGKIESFQGMYESFNKSTFDFTAIMHIKMMKYGQILGVQKKKAQLNLIELLSNITSISNNMSYSGDGSFYIPSMVCEHEIIE